MSFVSLSQSPVFRRQWSSTYSALQASQLPRSEAFLSTAELLDKLKAILLQRQDDLPRDLQRFTSLHDQA